MYLPTCNTIEYENNLYYYTYVSYTTLALHILHTVSAALYSCSVHCMYIIDHHSLAFKLPAVAVSGASW